MAALTDGMKVKALKTLSNVIIKGGIYDVTTLRKEISCINVEDTNWFEPYIESKFKIGDLVSFLNTNGKQVTTEGRKLAVDGTQIFKVVSVEPKRCYRSIVPAYTIENEFGHRFNNVSESSITTVPIYFVLSFSDKCINIHQINQLTFDKKYRGMAKAMFVYHTIEDALKAKEYFENYLKNRKYVIG